MSDTILSRSTNIKEAARYYEGERRGLSDRFISNIETALDSITAMPAASPILEGSIRRKLVRVFPYAILYADRPESIFIVAVMHCNREPGYWKDRLA